jgi:glyoxylase-like metal-dependent hydrolase (beta-lactamase superfamily II)
MNAGVYPLSEGTYTIAGDHVFVPFNQATDNFKDRPASLLVEIQPFLIVTSKDLIIIDPGLGFTTSTGQLQIHENLNKLGISAADITKVLLSHLHIDHTGGVVEQVIQNGSWQWQPAFPNATYYFQQQEWEYAMSKSYPSYDVLRLEQMKANTKHVVLAGDTVIDDYIQFEICGGHTPFHQVIKIKDQGIIYFFGGDVVPQFSQVQRRFVAKYDVDGVKSAALRKAYAEQALQERWICLFFHDLRTPYCKIGIQDGMYSAEQV